MKGEAQLKNCTQKTASSSFLQQMYKQVCLSLPGHCEAQGPTLVLLGSQRAPMDRNGIVPSSALPHRQRQ